MLSTLSFKNNLGKVTCYKCGAPLDEADFAPLTQGSLALIAYVVCAKCHAQSIVTLTPAGVGAVPLVADLSAEEVKKFMSLGPITYEEILQLHEVLKKETIWKLLQNQEKYLEKSQNNLEEVENYPQ